MTTRQTSRLISQSEANLHRRCPQAWNYGWVQRLEPLRDAVPIPREFGSWWHAVRAADSIRRGVDLGSLLYAPDKITTGDIGPVLVRDLEAETLDLYKLADSDDEFQPVTPERIFTLAEAWWKTLSGEEKERWSEHLGGTLAERLRALNTRWEAVWGKETAKEEPLAVEIRATRKVSEKSSIEFRATADEVYRDTKRNLIVVRDHKTSKSLPPSDALADLMDSQLHLYEWTLAKWFESEHGLKINATAYDRVRTTAPKAPVVTQAGKLSKSVTDYDLQTYLDWVDGGVEWGEPGKYFVSGAKKGEPKFGTYEAEESVIADLSSPASQSVWNQRTLTPANRNIVKSHLLSLVDADRDISRSVVRVEETGEAARNMTRACSYCDFLQICYAQIVGGPEGEYDLESLGLQRKLD